MFFLRGLIVSVLLAAASGAAERPNVLLAIADDWSYGHAGGYGCDWVETPNFDRVASEGVLFRNHYTPNAKCAPSRACLLTGRNSWQLEDAANHVPFFPAKFRGYPEALKDAGYIVGWTGKGWSPGVAKRADGAPRSLTGKGWNERLEEPPTSGISPNDYASNFADFVAAAGDTPWCFWYGALEPHRGYEYGTGARLGGKSIGDIDRVPAYWPDDDVVRNDMLDYALEVEHFDQHLGRMLRTLEEQGELDNTLVIVTSDHGMPFPRVKGQAYVDSNHIPLAIRWPAKITKPGRTVDDYVRMIDLAPTILVAAGVTPEASGMAPITGKSLAPLLEADRSGQINPGRDHVVIGKERHDIGRPHDAGYPIRGIVTQKWLYVHNYETDRWPAGNPETGYLNCDASPTKTKVLDAWGTDGNHLWRLSFGKRSADELYDLTSDGDCVHNLAANPQHGETLKKLKERMEAELTADGDPRMAGRGAEFDAYPYANAANRGFYKRFEQGERPPAKWVAPSDFRPEQNPDPTPQSRRDR